MTACQSIHLDSRGNRLLLVGEFSDNGKFVITDSTFMSMEEDGSSDQGYRHCSLVTDASGSQILRDFPIQPSQYSKLSPFSEKDVKVFENAEGEFWAIFNDSSTGQLFTFYTKVGVFDHWAISAIKTNSVKDYAERISDKLEKGYKLVCDYAVWVPLERVMLDSRTRKPIV